MLHPHRHRYRRALRKIEEELAATAPGLAQTLSKDRPSVQTRIWKTLLVLAEITAILMITVGLFDAHADLFLSGFAAAGVLIWVHKAFRATPHERSTDPPP